MRLFFACVECNVGISIYSSNKINFDVKVWVWFAHIFTGNHFISE